VQTVGTGLCSILDTQTNRPVSVSVGLTEGTEINGFSRKVAEKLIEAIQLIEIIEDEE
jgi:hypothetical protein